ncbi:Protein indeterminate-domain 7 [Bienertia sinuspersici]
MIKQQQQVFLEENMSNLTSAASGEASISSGNNNNININNKRGEPSNSIYPSSTHHQHYFPHQSEDEPQQPPAKKKRNLPGNPDPEAEVIALSPTSLLATNRFVCEICNKGFQRDQNLQLHRRGHNLPWKLKQRTNKEVRKKVYVCPEPSCVHHDPSRALGDLTGIKKHFCRKHGEKKYKCEKCSKRYAVQSDWKAHSKVCGTREYRCDCGTLFSRRDSFITHRAFCDALAEETARAITTTNPLLSNPIAAAGVGPSTSHFINLQQQQQQQLLNNQQQDPLHAFPLKREQNLISLPPWLACPPMDHTSFHHQDQMMQQHHQHQQQHQQQQQQEQQNQNPSNPNMGPTFGIGGPYHTQAASHHPHMSATALLQKAAQMGATMSNTATLQPHQQQHQQQQQQHFHQQQYQQQQQSHVSDTNSNTTATTPPPTTTTTTTTAGLFGLNLSSRDHLQQQQQEIMPTSLSSFEMNKLQLHHQPMLLPPLVQPQTQTQAQTRTRTKAHLHLHHTSMT